MKEKKGITLLYILVLIIVFSISTNVYADDYPDDIYNGNYSLKEILANYNLVTFGKKDLDSHMTQNEFSKGNAKLYHINSRFLINGDLNVYRIDLLTNSDDLKSDTKSITPIDTRSGLFCGYYGVMVESTNCGISDSNFSNKLYINSDYFLSINNVRLSNSGSNVNYINYDRLYDSIITEQNKIKKGKYVTSTNGVAHIEIGGEYYIDDINDINNIIFDNFEANQNNLTIITINNTGNIKFPKIYASENNGEQSLIPTNDYIGMERPNSYYANNYVIDKYYGNIIWNVPNSNYIELPSAPFIGHLIAPNADLYGPELHYAGAFLVNSLYIEGNSEAHFYPLTNTNIPYKSSTTKYKAIPKINKNYGNIQFNYGINNESIEEGTVVSFIVKETEDYLFTDIEIKDENGSNIKLKKIGDKEYEFTMPAINVTITPQFKDKNIKNTLTQVFTNPQTRSNLLLVLVSITGFTFLGFRIIKKQKID